MGGANIDSKLEFAMHHTDPVYPCREWRFQGKLGFGGKYRSETNKVDCYREDETTEVLLLIDDINHALSLLSM